MPLSDADKMFIIRALAMHAALASGQAFSDTVVRFEERIRAHIDRDGAAAERPAAAVASGPRRRP